MENQNWKVRPYSGFLSRELFQSLETITNSVFLAIREKYKIEDENCEDIPQYLYQETRCRHHFGKFTLFNYFRSKILISPILDPALRTLRLNTSECPDYNLLISLLFTRYAPDLLKFPFDSKHSIAPETIACAQKINARFPRLLVSNKDNFGGVFRLQPRDLQAEKILAEGKNNPNILGTLPAICLKAIFESSRIYGLFTSYFDSELYNYAAVYYDNHIFNRFNYVTAVVGVTKVLEDVEISQHNRPLYQDMKRFLEQDFCRIDKDNNAVIVSKFKDYFTARVLVRLDKEMNADNLQIISYSDDKAKLFKPSWWQSKGICHELDSYVGKLEIVAKTLVDGLLQVRLSGAFTWIDYERLTINGNVIFDTIHSTHGNSPYVHSMNAKAGEEIKIQVEWLPHRSDT